MSKTQRTVFAPSGITAAQAKTALSFGGSNPVTTLGALTVHEPFVVKDAGEDTIFSVSGAINPVFQFGDSASEAFAQLTVTPGGPAVEFSFRHGAAERLLLQTDGNGLTIKDASGNSISVINEGELKLRDANGNNRFYAANDGSFSLTDAAGGTRMAGSAGGFGLTISDAGGDTRGVFDEAGLIINSAAGALVHTIGTATLGFFGTTGIARAAFQAVPTALTLRDTLIAYGLMAPS